MRSEERSQRLAVPGLRFTPAKLRVLARRSRTGSARQAQLPTRIFIVLSDMLDSIRKHALVIAVAILLATYRLSRLESERGRRDATIEQEFENVVTFLHQRLDTAKYRVLRIAPPPHARSKMHAMVVNEGFTIPRVEAEVFVDQQLALDQQKQKRRDRQPKPPVVFRVYDAETMTPIAQTLQQRSLIVSYEQGRQPN